MKSNAKLKLAYCIPSIAMIAGGQRVLCIKANYFVEYLGYEVHIIVTDEGNKEPYFKLHPSIQIHNLDLNYGGGNKPIYKRVISYFYKKYLHRKRLNNCLNEIKPDFTVLMVRRELEFINKMTDGSMKIAENHIEKDKYLNDADITLRRYCPNILWNWQRKKTIKRLQQLQKFIVLTYEDADKWNELNNVVVIPNPLTILPTKISTNRLKQVAAVGRYTPQKGFDMLILAWKIVAEKHRDWVLRIFGDGWMRECLQKQIEENGLEDCCYLEYSVSNIVEKYQESSIFVLSSRYEGFGLVLVEAMACSLPVVSFACPCGPKDIIADGTDGFLVPLGSIEELADKISYLIGHDNVREQMGIEGVLKAKNYSIETIGMQWKDLFEKLILID